MLARIARSTVSQTPISKRCLSATATSAKAFQVSDVTPSAGVVVPPHVKSVSTVSSGELAWCEIYGVDYDEQVQEALNESPLLVNDVERALPTRAASPSSVASAKADIWNVVFGSASSSA